jgi:hypothetical protein
LVLILLFLDRAALHVTAKPVFHDINYGAKLGLGCNELLPVPHIHPKQYAGASCLKHATDDTSAFFAFSVHPASSLSSLYASTNNDPAATIAQKAHPRMIALRLKVVRLIPHRLQS